MSVNKALLGHSLAHSCLSQAGAVCGCFPGTMAVSRHCDRDCMDSKSCSMDHLALHRVSVLTSVLEPPHSLESVCLLSPRGGSASLLMNTTALTPKTGSPKDCLSLPRSVVGLVMVELLQPRSYLGTRGERRRGHSARRREVSALVPIVCSHLWSVTE